MRLTINPNAITGGETQRSINLRKIITFGEVLDFEIGFPYVNDDGTFSFDKEMSEIHKSIIRRDRKINYDNNSASQ